MWARMIARIMIRGRLIWDRIIGRALTRWGWKLVVLPAIALIGGIGLIAGSAMVGSAGIGTGVGTSGAPSDRFMDGIAEFSSEAILAGACPELLAGLEQAPLEQQMQSQREAAERAQTSQSWDLVGTRPRLDGGEVRFYLMTQTSPTQPDRQTSYVIWTAAAGCVERVE